MASRIVIPSIPSAALHAIHAFSPPSEQGQSWTLGSRDIGAFSCDLHDESLTWSQTTFDLFGLESGSRIDRRMTLEMYEPESRKALHAVRSHAIQSLSAFSLEAQIQSACGTQRWIRICASVESRNGHPVRLHGTKQDITEERRNLERLEALAYTDAVTGLGNRTWFHAAFLAPTHGAKLAAPAGALVLFDLDHFKALNDSHGHLAGDACLARFASKLKALFPDALLQARIGGDEFAMLLPRGLDEDALAQRLHRALRTLAIPVDWEGTPITIRASVGLAHVKGESTLDPNALFRLADADLYRAKALRPQPDR